MAEEDDPLVQALPPATDYFTYLTLLEYQLTPARLPTLHRLLQDEVLTSNIGWDLVHLLVPMLPQSLECLQDVARLGNPREVILRVSEALMQLQSEDDDDKDKQEELSLDELNVVDDYDELHDSENGRQDQTQPKLTAVGTGLSNRPRHVVRFNCLVAMLSTLHSRIRTKSPSRFVAMSLQAALEAYTLLPTSETTTALLEFLRDLSPSKRPAPPPRGTSESSVLRVSKESAPDPEAESRSHSPSLENDIETALVTRLLQFCLIEVLKSYLLSLSSPGMSWAIRLQEKLHPSFILVRSESQTDLYFSQKELRERDMIISRITALSRDLGISDEQLLAIISLPLETQPSQLDFDELPWNPEEIPLERHGALLLLAARNATSVIFSLEQKKPQPIRVFPTLSCIFANFIGEFENPDEVAFGHPQVLLDSLLTLTILSLEHHIDNASNEKDYQALVLQLTACVSRQDYGYIRRLSAAIYRSHPSSLARFKLLRRVLEDSNLYSIRECAIGWLKSELLSSDERPEQPEPSASSIISMDPITTKNTNNSILLDPHYFSILFPSLYNSSELLLDVSSQISASWIKFAQALTPSIHAALSLYYILVSSSRLRSQLQLQKTLPYFRTRYLEPLKSLCHAFENDRPANGGEGRIEAVVGENIYQVGMARSVDVISLLVGRIEDVLRDAFALSDDDEEESGCGM